MSWMRGRVLSCTHSYERDSMVITVTPSGHRGRRYHWEGAGFFTCHDVWEGRAERSEVRAMQGSREKRHVSDPGGGIGTSTNVVTAVQNNL